MRFAIAAGGTGGHLFPGLAVAEVLHARGHEVMVLTSEKHIDAVATEGRSEFRIERLPGVGLPRILSPRIALFVWRFGLGVMQCRRLFSDFKPLAVLGMGGFTSTAPILAARLAGLPAFVHESNAIPGKANRLNSFLAGGLLVGLEDCARVMPETDCVFTGTPIRRALLSAPDQPEARKRFGLDGGLPTLLVMGGSQGAAGINRAMVDAAPLLKKDGLQVIHITGQSDEKMVRESYAKEGVRAWVGAFHHAMQDAYAAATLAIARSGAASLTELAHFELPSILIPFPFAAEDHQTFNALVFERAGAAKLVAEKEVTPEKLVAEIRSMLLSGQRDGMIQGCRSVKIGDAAERVATVLEESAKGKGVFHE